MRCEEPALSAGDRPARFAAYATAMFAWITSDGCPSRTCWSASSVPTSWSGFAPILGPVDPRAAPCHAPVAPRPTHGPDGIALPDDRKHGPTSHSRSSRRRGLFAATPALLAERRYRPNHAGHADAAVSMSNPAAWARTQGRLTESRRPGPGGAGPRGAAGNSTIARPETAYVEQLGVVTIRPRPLAPVRPRSYTFAPVGAECTSRELPGHGQAQDSEPCAGCGCGVVHSGAKRTRKRARCSLWCADRAWAAAHPKWPSQPAGGNPSGVRTPGRASWTSAGRSGLISRSTPCRSAS